MSLFFNEAYDEDQNRNRTINRISNSMPTSTDDSSLTGTKAVAKELKNRNQKAINSGEKSIASSSDALSAVRNARKNDNYDKAQLKDKLSNSKKYSNNAKKDSAEYKNLKANIFTAIDAVDRHNRRHPETKIENAFLAEAYDNLI